MKEIKSVENALQELFDVLIDNKCNNDVLSKFYQVSTIYQEEKKVVKTMNKEIVDFLTR